MEHQTLRDSVWESYSKDLIAAQEKDIPLPKYKKDNCLTERPDKSTPTNFEENEPSDISRTLSNSSSQDDKEIESEISSSEMEKSRFISRPTSPQLHDILEYVVGLDEKKSRLTSDNKMNFDSTTLRPAPAADPSTSHFKGISPRIANNNLHNVAVPQPRQPRTFEGSCSTPYLHERAAPQRNNHGASSSPVIQPISPHYYNSPHNSPIHLQSLSMGSTSPSVANRPSCLQNKSPHNFERFNPDSQRIPSTIAPFSNQLDPFTQQELTMEQMGNNLRQTGRIPEAASQRFFAPQNIQQHSGNYMFPKPAVPNIAPAPMKPMNNADYYPTLPKNGPFPTNEEQHMRRMAMGCLPTTFNQAPTNWMPPQQTMNLPGPSHATPMNSIHEMSRMGYQARTPRKANTQSRQTRNNSLKQTRKKRVTQARTSGDETIIRKRKELEQKMVELLCDKEYCDEEKSQIITRHLYHTQTCQNWLTNDNCPQCQLICEMVAHSARCSDIRCSNVYCAVVARSVTDLFSKPNFVYGFLKELHFSEEDMKDVYVFTNK